MMEIENSSVLERVKFQLFVNQCVCMTNLYAQVTDT